MCGSCVLLWLLKPILVLNCRLQDKQANPESNNSDDHPFAFFTIFFSASQTLFDSYLNATFIDPVLSVSRTQLEC